jgi:hypothetical protein
MSKIFVLPENCDPEEINKIIENIREFAKKTGNDDWDDNIGCVTKLDEKIVNEYAEGFCEFRQIGTDGLSKKYVGRYSIHIYGSLPHYIYNMIKDLTKSTLVEIKDKQNGSDW